MTTKRRFFTEEFKVEAVALLESSGGFHATAGLSHGAATGTADEYSGGVRLPSL